MRRDYTRTDSNVNTLANYSWVNNLDMGIKDELQRRMDACGENPHSLATKTKVTQATLWRILAGESIEPKESTVSKLARFFGISNDEMWGRASSSATPTPTDPGDEFVAVARVSLRVSAGVTGFRVEHLDGNGPPIFFRADWLAARGLKAVQLYALKVMGDSMEPNLWADDLVVINSADATPKDGEVFVANYEGEVVIKRLMRDAGEWWLTSDNPRHKPKRCDEHAELIGRVIYRQTERI